MNIIELNSQGWQTMSLATGADVNPAKHARMACKTEEFEVVHYILPYSLNSLKE